MLREKKKSPKGNKGASCSDGDIPGERHFKLLDKFSGDNLYELKSKYLVKYNQYKKLKEEIAKNYGDDKERQRKLDLLKYQSNEILEANLKKGEESELEEKKKKILNAEKLSKNLEIAKNEILNVSLDSITSAMRALEKIEDINEEYKISAETIRNIYYELEDCRKKYIRLFRRHIF